MVVMVMWAPCDSLPDGISTYSVKAEDLRVVVICNACQCIADSSTELVQIPDACDAMLWSTALEFAIGTEVSFRPGKNKGQRQRHG